MAEAGDPWYVRLPDGRTLRAESTQALRRSLGKGRIPWESTVRRSPDRAWLPLERVPELADLHRGDGVPRRRPDSHDELHPVGARSLVEELWNAVDSSLSRRKLVPAALTGLVAAGAWIGGADLAPIWLEPPSLWLSRLAAGLCLLVSLSVCTSWLTQMTYVELARLRPARRSELRVGLFRYVVRLMIAQIVVGVAFAVPLAALRWLAGTFSAADPGTWQEGVRSVILAARLLWEVCGWPMFLMSLLLLGPLVVVEDHSVVRSLRELLGLLRKHLGRIYLYEALAFVLGGIMTVPLLLPIGLTAARITMGRGLNQVEEATLSVLLGLASTPFFAYLLVANVFIYLNLRYEFRPAGR